LDLVGATVPIALSFCGRALTLQLYRAAVLTVCVPCAAAVVISDIEILTLSRFAVGL